MSNVFPLISEKKLKGTTDPKSPVAIAAVAFMAASVKLAKAIKELSRSLEVLDSLVESLEDTSAKERLRQVSKVNRESLRRAVEGLLYPTGNVRRLPDKNDPRFCANSGGTSVLGAFQ
ncbi:MULTISPECIES: hypothetical protein [unclassified Bradyrhizobium]|uniref:hypothetical protein n=1 Tax=unclassified Bradyrhizobium TaxID=2631580 RepID=UPI002FF1163B